MTGELPNLADVVAAPARTLKHVPLAARAAWAQALTRALAAAAAYNSVDAWTELLMLAKTVLLAPLRAGKKNRRTAAAFTLERLSRWEAGHRESLWEDVLDRKAGPHKQEDEAARRRRAEALCREGFDRKACAALISNGVLPADTSTLRSLEKLHPRKPCPSCPSNEQLPQAAEIDWDTLEASVRSFPLDSAAGPTGL